jgi:hypothetical protein
VIDAREPFEEPLGVPPRWLLPEARRLWREMMARWREAETRAPYEPLPASYAATIAGIAAKLGLNVADRAKLRLPEPMKRDPLAELLDDAG